MNPSHEKGCVMKRVLSVLILVLVIAAPCAAFGWGDRMERRGVRDQRIGAALQREGYTKAGQWLQQRGQRLQRIGERRENGTQTH